MNVDEQLIDHLANLSRLDFDAGEKQLMIRDMEKIIGFVEKLNELDTSGVEPVRFMGDHSNVFRNDIAGDMLTKEEALHTAAKRDEAFFKVPKVIRKENQ